MCYKADKDESYIRSKLVAIVTITVIGLQPPLCPSEITKEFQQKNKNGKNTNQSQNSNSSVTTRATVTLAATDRFSVAAV